MRSNDMRIGLAAVLAAVVLPAAAAAQLKPLALEVRGGLNWAVDDLQDGIGLDMDGNGDPVAAARQHGWTGSADLFWTLAPRSAVYVGWNHAGFKCKTEVCGSDGRMWSAGPELGFKFSVLNNENFSPWVRGGLLAHKAKYKEGPAPEENSVRSPGFELGLGTDLSFGNVLALVPAIRYYRYNAGWDLGTVERKRLRKNIAWYQTDLGIQLKLGHR